MTRHGSILLGLVGLTAAGCGFSIGAKQDSAGDASIADSAPFADAGTCGAPSVACAGDSTLRTCSAAGAQAMDQACTWSCIEAGPSASHCGMFTPSGGAVRAGDLVPTAQLSNDVATTVDVTIDTNSGAMSGGIVRGPGPLGAGIAYEVRGNVAVFTMKSLHVRNVAVGGDHAIALVAAGPIVIDGVIDLRGAPVCAGPSGGPGGDDGGLAGTADGAAGGNNKGGGGGGHGGKGGAGGGNSNSGGMPRGDDRISILAGGGAGGVGGGGGGGAGGGGGGALQLVSNTSIEITGTGAINAGGCGGSGGGGGPKDSGGGGGAGGAILVEAPRVMIGGIVAANGGGGGGGKSAPAGQPGSLDAVRAPGGTQAGASRGGDGGAGAMFDGGAGQQSNNSGGGGGGVGRIRINVRPQTSPLTQGATFSPPLGGAGTPATAGAANVN